MGARRGNLVTSPETLGGEAGRTLWVKHRHQPQQLQRACYRVGMKRHPALPLSSKMRLQPLAAEGPCFISDRARTAGCPLGPPKPPAAATILEQVLSAHPKCL